MLHDRDDSTAGERILQYLNDHPDAADTAEGIRQWWLRHEGDDWSAAEVRAVLDLLAARHLITRVDRPGMPPVYRAAPRGGGDRGER